METTYEIETFKVSLTISEPTRNPIHAPETFVVILQEIYSSLDADREHFTVVALDNKNRPRGFKVLFAGSETSSLVDPRTVFLAGLRLSAVKLILCHNHPAGDPSPSAEDIHLTRNLARIGRFLYLPILDHIILGNHTPSYYSFSTHGMMVNEAPEDEIGRGLRLSDYKVLSEVRSVLELQDTMARRAIRDTARKARAEAEMRRKRQSPSAVV